MWYRWLMIITLCLLIPRPGMSSPDRGFSGGAVQTRYQTACMHWNRGDVDAAIREARQAVEADPNFADSHYLLGFAYAQKGQTQEAMESLERYVQLAPEAEWAPQARQKLRELRVVAGAAQPGPAGGFQSAVLTNCWTPLSLDPTRIQAERKGLTVVNAQPDCLALRLADSGDTVFIRADGRIIVASEKPLFAGELENPPQVEVLEKELGPIVDLIADTMAGVTEEQKKQVKYFRAQFYGDPVGVYHRLAGPGLSPSMPGMGGPLGSQLTLVVPLVEVRKARAEGITIGDLQGDVKAALVPGIHKVGQWDDGETLEVFTNPTSFGFALGGVGAEYIIQQKNRSMSELAPLIPGLSAPPATSAPLLEPRSAIATHLETRLNLEAVRAQAERYLLEATQAEGDHVGIRFWAGSGDCAYVYNDGYIVILSANPFSDIAWPLVLQAELNKVVNLIAELFPNAPEEQKRVVMYRKAQFYADPVGVYHRLLFGGYVKGVLSVPGCEVRNARMVPFPVQFPVLFPPRIYLQGGEVAEDVTPVVIPGAQLDLKVGEGGGMGAGFIGFSALFEALTAPTQEGFGLQGEGVENVFYQRNLSLRELVFVCPHCKFWNPPRVTRCRKCERPPNQTPPSQEPDQSPVVVDLNNFLAAVQAVEGAETAGAAVPLLAAHLHLWLGLDALRGNEEERKARAEEAAAHLQQVDATMPDNARLHVALAKAHEAAGNEEASRKEAAEALKLGAKPSDFEGFEKPPAKAVSVPREEVLEALQQAEQAGDERALSLCYVWVGDYHREKQEMDPAWACYEKAIKQDSACVGALVGMAYVHEAQGQARDIRQKLNQAHHFDETYPRLVRAIEDFEKRYQEELIPPHLELLRPTDGGHVPRAPAIPIEVKVTDDRSGVSHVQARDGDKEWEQVGGAGVFKLTWDTRRGPRERTLEIRAWDKAGNVAWTTIQVKVGP